MTLDDRVTALERAVAALTSSSGSAVERAVGGDADLGLLDALRAQAPDGGVGFAGHLPTEDGPVAWQWSRPTEDLLARDWSDAADRLGALGHPVRLRLLHQVLTGTTTTAELADDAELGTTGQLHHHLRILMASGWLMSAGRGRYVIPTQRIIPLLAIVSATE